MSDMTAFFTVELDDDGKHRTGARRRVRRDEQDLHEPRGQAHRGLRHRKGRLAMADAAPAPLPRRAARRSRGRPSAALDLVAERARPHDGGAAPPGHRARVDRDPRRRPPRRPLPRGPPGHPLAARAAGAGRRRPARRGRPAARDQARRAHGRPMREHRQDAPARRATSRPSTRRSSSASCTWAGSRAPRSSRPSRRSCCATSRSRRTSCARTREINALNREASSARSRSGRTPTAASGR